MGLLSEGSPLTWEETKKYADHVRKHGIIQFLNIYQKLKDRQGDTLKWGDEVEYMLVTFDHEAKTAKLNLDGVKYLKVLEEKEVNNPDDHPALWRPEYAAYMLEGTPAKPYGGQMAHFNMVEASMKQRREEVRKLITENDSPLSVTSFPRLGCPNFTTPSYQPTITEAGVSRSLYFPDEAINGTHPRFKTLTRNIRSRKGEKIAINIPIFKDKNTPSPFLENFDVDIDGQGAKASKPDHIYMDAMGFGMGNSCLQVTFQACNIREARHLYDQLAPLCPILLALSAASPLYKGYVSDIDCRWNIIAASVDCRTKEERGLEPLKNDRYVIPKSRYDSIDSYISEEGDRYNDIDLVFDEDICQHLMNSGIDRLLARHIAHLFIRDPVSLFSEKINLDDENDTDHFENIQSTNWQTMRFKPPPANSPIGWRVEFRPSEVQLTDFENAAYVVFVVLLTRVILSFKLNFLMPISKVDYNMQEAQKRDAVGQCKFYFRKDLRTCYANDPQCNNVNIHDECALMSIDTIINGGEVDGVEFPGVIPLIKDYLQTVEVDVDTSCTIVQYLELISRRASGKLITMAKWIRQFVSQHPDYKQDSVVSEQINYDLMVACDKITKGELEAPELMFTPVPKTREDLPPLIKKMEEKYAAEEKKRAEQGAAETS
ncbi:glutamate--cysteine ligase catalytic subunit-like [Ptychodera flava]|uniref:glutamate--cysteine ligase catalytic subunit-like n=1 Tax=Ptychodera flava TaxID=63121 RepID=UPI003969C7F7